jgi:hypothetical protein
MEKKVSIKDIAKMVVSYLILHKAVFVKINEQRASYLNIFDRWSTEAEQVFTVLILQFHTYKKIK